MSPSPEIKKEPVTLDKPKSPNPFLHVTHVDFTFDEIAFTTNNEVALIYPSHPNQEYFMAVSDFISKCCLLEVFTRAPTQYKEYLSEFWYTAKTLDNSKIWVFTPTCGVRGEICITTFRNALKAHYLPHSTMYVLLPFITAVDYAKIIWDDLIHKLNKKTREKIFPYPRFISLLLEHMAPEYENKELTINLTQVFSVHNLTLKPNQPEEPPFTDHMKAICNLVVLVDSKALKPSSQTKKSSLDKDKSSSHLSPPIPMVGEMHREAQQAACGPTSLRATRRDVLADSTAKADPGPSALNDSIPPQQDLLKDTRSSFFTPDSPPYDPINVSDESDQEEVEKVKKTPATSQDVPEDTSKKELKQLKAAAEAEVALLKAKPLYPDIIQLTSLLLTSLKPELAKLFASHDLASCLPSELKELPSKVTKLSLLNKVTNTLNRFATMVKNASGATTADVSSAGKSTASPAEGEKNTKDFGTNLKNELVDLLGIDVVTQYYNNKIYREDGTAEVIENFKASNLHLAKWREVVQACPNIKEKG
nr:hypothetical protein [Tanacetum cinerariifolium]